MNTLLNTSIRQDMENLNSLLELRMYNVSVNEGKVICIAHETYWGDMSVRISNKHDPFLNMFGFTTDKIQKESTK